MHGQTWRESVWSVQKLPKYNTELWSSTGSKISGTDTLIKYTKIIKCQTRQNYISTKKLVMFNNLINPFKVPGYNNTKMPHDLDFPRNDPS